MNLLLIIRAELVCLLILVFITLYSRLYNMGKDQGSFVRMCIYSIGHVVFDLVTVITVNSAGACPPVLNKICHILFYMFALLFSHEFLCYTVALGYSKKIQKAVRIAGLALITVYMAAVPFLPMEYIAGEGTKYSFGLSAFVGYGLAMLFFVASIVLVVWNCKKIDKYVVGALLPMLIAAIVAEITQIIVPEMLFTGGAVTVITVGFFFSLENPVVVLSHKVFIDTMTGVKSRHSYDADIVRMNRRFEDGTQYGMVFCDLNGLKAVNDSHGHLEGDAYIASVAQILMNNLRSSETIYRMGGDEFLAVYQDKSAAVIRKEIAAAVEECRKQSLGMDYTMSMAIGYAVSDKSYRCLRDVLNKADCRMYADKAKIKMRNSVMHGSDDELNQFGYAYRAFEGFDISEIKEFLFVTDMSSGSTRWSEPAANYFAFGDSCGDSFVIPKECIHTDDLAHFSRIIGAVRNGDEKMCSIRCRLKNVKGDYVVCLLYGNVISDNNGGNRVFAGTVFVHGDDALCDMAANETDDAD